MVELWSTRDSAHQLTPAVGELHRYANITATQIFLRPVVVDHLFLHQLGSYG